MVQLFDYFKFARQLEFKEGSIILMQVPVNIVPISILCELQKGYIEDIGFQKAYDHTYSRAKAGSTIYNKKFIQQLGFSDKRKTLEWQIKIVSFAGWGKLELIKVAPEEKSVIVRYNDPLFAKEYGKSRYPVDFMAVGFTAGGVSANFGTDVDALETKCVAIGDPYCEVEVGTPKLIKTKRVALWNKLGIKDG